jgi:hypothetical protein
LSAEENYISAIERQVTGGFVNGGIHKLYWSRNFIRQVKLSGMLAGLVDVMGESRYNKGTGVLT